MTYGESKRLEMLQRVRAFHNGYAEDAFPPKSLGHQLFALVDSIIAEVNEHSVSQRLGLYGARGNAERKKRARKALREFLLKISRTARILTIEKASLKALFRVPDRGGDRRLLFTARAFAKNAAARKAAFIKHEMPDDFLEQLDSAIRELQEASNQRTVSRQSHVVATRAVTAAIKKGVVAVKRLDVIVRNKLGKDRLAMKLWERYSRVPGKRRKKSSRAKTAAQTTQITRTKSAQSA